MRFKVEMLIEGQIEAFPSDIQYLTLDELKRRMPSSYEAIVSDISCVGTYSKTESGLRYRVTDRERTY
jgi:hypothetical protein